MAYYIDNKRFTQAVAEHREAVLRARAPLLEAIYKTRSGPHRIYRLALLRQHTDPQVPDYLAKSFLAIATRLAEKACFRNSPYVDDMISAAVFDCVKGAHKFDPAKTHNAFGYFTRICVRAFFHILRAEEKLSSRFVLGDLPESIDFEAPMIPVPVSAADVEQGTRALLQAWVNHHGKNGYMRRGWPPLEQFEQLTREYLQENPPQATVLAQGAPLRGV